MSKIITTMPDGLSKYGESPVFDAVSVPKKLLQEHSIKAGAWGRLCVKAGEVRYFLPENAAPEAVLSAGDVHIVQPLVTHYIKVSDDAVFQIEFWS